MIIKSVLKTGVVAIASFITCSHVSATESMSASTLDVVSESTQQSAISHNPLTLGAHNDSQANSHSGDNLWGYSSKGREVFDVVTSEGNIIKAVDVNGTAYSGDIILGNTRALKNFGLKIVQSDEDEALIQQNRRHEIHGTVIQPTSGAKWPNGIVPYVLSSNLTTAGRNAANYGINHWNNNTNIQFVPRTNQSDYILIQDSTGCGSNVGRVGGMQTVNLASGCGNRGGVHELGHAIGFWHEHTRPDRDNYVSINWNNIPSANQHNFNKQTGSAGRGSYDFYSIMHYRLNEWGINGSQTIVPQVSGVDTSRVGYGSTLTSGDISAANYLYPGSGGGGGGGQTDTPIQNGYSTTLNINSGQWRYFTFQVSSNANLQSISAQTSGGTGDADVFIRLGQRPTGQSGSACSSAQSGNTETCTVNNPQPGTYYIGVLSWTGQGYTTPVRNANFSFSTTTNSNGGGRGNTGGSTSFANISGAAGSWTNHEIQLPSGMSSLNVTMSGGTGDGDLYVRRASLPTQQSFDCRSWNSNNNENCSVANPAAGTWYVSVRGYSSFSGANINVEWSP